MIKPIQMSSPSFGGNIKIGRDKDRCAYIIRLIGHTDDAAQDVFIRGLNDLREELEEVTPDDYSGALELDLVDENAHSRCNKWVITLRDDAPKRKGWNPFKKKEDELSKTRVLASALKPGDRSSGIGAKEAEKLINDAEEGIYELYIEPGE